jgi:hypothetical protein
MSLSLISRNGSFSELASPHFSASELTIDTEPSEISDSVTETSSPIRRKKVWFAPIPDVKECPWVDRTPIIPHPNRKPLNQDHPFSFSPFGTKKKSKQSMRKKFMAIFDGCDKTVLY